METIQHLFYNIEKASLSHVVHLNLSLCFEIQSIRHRINTEHRRDTCFDAHLFRRLFCLYHVMLCARSDDVTACCCFCK